MESQYGEDLDSTTVRLVDITLEPDPHDDSRLIPSLTVRRHALNEQSPYYALSYTWGPPSPGDPPYTPASMLPILLNGTSFMIFPNLYDALLQLRISYPGMPFWIDAICINQGHRAEREMQVGMMDQIYRRATKVIVWLGAVMEEHREDIQRGSKLIKRYAQVASHEIIQILEAQSISSSNMDVRRPEDFERRGLPPLTERDALALIAFYRSRWFHRIWILQEVALATEAEACWGDISLSWDDIGLTAVFLQLSTIVAGIGVHYLSALDLIITDVEHRLTGFLVSMRIQVIRELCKGKDSKLAQIFDLFEFAPGTPGSSASHWLFKLILWTRISFQASEKRDGVYGFLGILNHMDPGKDIPARLRPNYAAPRADVMQLFTAQLIEATQSLQVLGLVCDPSLREVSGTPSWVPDLSPAVAANPILGPSMRSLVHDDMLFHASTKEAGHEDDCFFHFEDERLLHVHGQKIAAVGITGEEMSEALQGGLQGWAEVMLAMESTYSPTGQTNGDAFRRTLVLDQDISSRPASTDALDKIQLGLTWMLLHAIRQLPNIDAVMDFLAAQDVVFRAAETTQDCILPKRHVVQAFCRQRFGIQLEPDNDRPHEEQADDDDNGHESAWIKTPPVEASILIETLGHRRPFLLAGNVYVACGPKSTVEGDEVWIISGCRTPMVLRKLEHQTGELNAERNPYAVVGEAYVHGIMYGEFVDDDAPWEDLWLA